MYRQCFSVINVLFCFSVAYAEYTAADFFISAPPECITAVESITAMEKTEIIESGFTPSKGPYTQFSVLSIEPDRLQLRDVDIHVHYRNEGGWLVSVTSILGNHGQNQHTTFYLISEAGEIMGEMNPHDLGIRDVLNNEFLNEEDHFPEEENYPVPLYVRDDGNFQAEPWTWLNDQWLDREIIRSIAYIWNGENFILELEDM